MDEGTAWCRYYATHVRKRGLGLLLAGAALVVSGCTAQGPPEVSFYADGDTARAEPMVHCDVLVKNCDETGNPVSLPVRPGKPVQLSIPNAIAETPWAVTVQYRTSDGKVNYKHETFTSGEQYAYTADPSGKENQILVVEIQQISAAYATTEQGKISLDAGGNPQLVARGIWSLRVDPR